MRRRGRDESPPRDLEHGSNSGGHRRQRKPEQQYYQVHKTPETNAVPTSKLAGRLNFGAGAGGGPDKPVDMHGNRDNDHRRSRQNSENAPAPMRNQNNNNHHHQRPPMTDYNQPDDRRFSRDTRSLESNHHRDRQMKPPSGRRNSNASDNKGSLPPWLPSNIESLPPRLKKKLLEEHGLPLSYLDNLNLNQGNGSNNNHHYNRNSGNNNWSHTLPAKGRGGGHQNNYGQSDRGHHDSWRPRGGGGGGGGHRQHNNRSRSRGSDVSYDDGDFRSSNRSLNMQHDGDMHNGPRSYSSRRGGGFQRKRNDSEYSNEYFPSSGYSRSNKSGSNYGGKFSRGGGDDQYSSQEHMDRGGGGGGGSSLKVVEDDSSGRYKNSHKRRGRRKRNKRKSGYDQQQRSHPSQQQQPRVPYGGGQSMPYRDRRPSQSSNPNQSRENSMERNYRTRHFHNRSRKNSYENGSRESSVDRQSLTGGDFNVQHNQRHFRNSRNRNRPPSGDRRQQWSSRENSTDSVRMREQNQNQSRRGNRNIDKEFENISIQISTLTTKEAKDESERHVRIPGVIQLPGKRNHGEGNSYANNSRRQRNDSNVSGRPADSISLNKFLATCPAWYKENSEAYTQVIHDKNLIDHLVECDFDMHELVRNGTLLQDWETYDSYRRTIQQLLQQFISREIKFCMTYNVENHIWKILYYSPIEMLKGFFNDEAVPEEQRKFFFDKSLEMIDEGLTFFERCVKLLEEHYKFSVNDYIGENALIVTKGLKFLGLALVSAQKMFLFLGDLARYRELINKTQNFGISRQWYTKAQQIMPSNGRPYYQLGVLSVYSKRKVDAVYYFMRNLMSSSPLESAKENLKTLFDDIRKKYETSQKKRDEKCRQRLKEKEHKFGGPLRRETWIHPSGGRRIHRTTPLDLGTGKSGDTSDEEELNAMSTTDLNKRFITSYLHVHGKLITKIGMESFTQCAVQMLREFRAVLRIAPIPITQLRLLQLAALNMFAIESTQLKDTSLAPGARSSVQECAISVALMMFGLILERFIVLLKEILAAAAKLKCDTPETPAKEPRKPAKFSWAADSADCDEEDRTEPVEVSEADKKVLLLNEDARVLLPSIKIWCDWLLNNNHVWNPPPQCTVDYKIGPNSGQYDPWTKLGQLAMLLAGVNVARDLLSGEKRDDNETVRLEEDITLAGFTPLFCNVPMEIYCHRDIDKDMAQAALRFQKILFVISDCLCNCDPPVLKRVSGRSNGKGNWAVETGLGGAEATHEYVSVVQSRTDESSDSDYVLESFSDDESPAVGNNTSIAVAAAAADVGTQLVNGFQDEVEEEQKESVDRRPESAELRKLLRRKVELERSNKIQEKRHERYQDILRQSSIQVHIEVRPKFLIPDTNCFVDSCQSLIKIAESYPLFQLLVPLVVVNELDGLSKGNNSTTNSGATQKKSDPVHVQKVAEASKEALSFLKAKKHPGVKWVTTKGSFLTTAVFTIEDEMSELMSNDDKILTTAETLCRNNSEQIRDGTRYIKQEVVLLTTDRNLRVKALSRDVPVRELPDFIRWAGLAAGQGN